MRSSAPRSRCSRKLSRPATTWWRSQATADGPPAGARSPAAALAPGRPAARFPQIQQRSGNLPRRPVRRQRADGSLRTEVRSPAEDVVRSLADRRPCGSRARSRTTWAEGLLGKLAGRTGGGSYETDSVAGFARPSSDCAKAGNSTPESRPARTIDDATDEDTSPAPTPSSAATTTKDTLVACISPLATMPGALIEPR